MVAKTPTSYKDAYWTDLAANAETKVGLPTGLLRTIVSHGERSNADQVSEAGAKTVFQIIPQTRKAVLDKYGVDAYLSPENAAEASALLLKESLDRNKGDVGLAVAEYHGGTNRDNWGPRTRAYVGRVSSGLKQYAQAEPATMTDAVPDLTPDDISTLYTAYTSGGMDAQQKADYEADVAAGIVSLPQGASLARAQEATPSAQPQSGVPDLSPDDIVSLYLAYDGGQMTPEQVSDYEADVTDGLVPLPSGASLKKDRPEPVAPAEPESTVAGVGGAITRGLAPITAGATVGALAGAPFGGVGAIPGAAAGAAAAGLTMAVGDPVVSSVNSLLGTNYTLPTQAMEDLLTRVGVPGPKSAAERVIQTATTGAASAGSTAALGQVLKAGAAPLTQAVGQSLAANPAAQIAGGAAGGASGQTAAEMGAGTGAQLAANLAGGLVGSKVAGTAARPVPAAPAVVSDAERAGIKLMTSDVVQPKTFAAKWLQSVGERIPLAGTGGMRQTQQQQRIDAVRNLLLDYGADDTANASEKVMADLAAKRGRELAKYSEMKTAVFDKLKGKGIVPVDNTVKAVDEQIAALSSQRLKDLEPVIARMEDWKNAIQNQDIANVELIRKQIGESFKAPELSSVRSVGEKALNQIYPAVVKDIGDFIKVNGEPRDFNKWQVANKRLSSLAGELDKGALKSVLRSGEATPEDVKKLLFSKKPSDVRALYSNLTNEGRASARLAVISKAVDDAGGIENISPERFVNSIKKLGVSTGVLFSGDDLKRIEGLARALDATRRASSAAASPTTGVQVAIPVGAAVLTDILGGAGAATVGAATIGGLARVYESAPVRNLLLKIQQAPKGSAQEAELAKRLINVMQTQSETMNKSQEQK